MQAVVDPSGPSVVGFAPSNAVLMGDFQNFIKVDYPLEMDQETLGVTKDGDEYVFCVDPSKVQAKTAQAWTALRAERNARLAACDWTQMPDPSHKPPGRRGPITASLSVISLRTRRTRRRSRGRSRPPSRPSDWIASHGDLGAAQ